MNSRTNLALIALLGLSFLPVFAGVQAQSITSPYRFLETKQEGGAFVGHMSVGTGRFGYGPKPGVVVGGRYGLDISGPFGLEGVVTYLPTTRDIIDPGREEGDRYVGEMGSDIIMIDGRLRFSLTGDRTWHGVSPFVLAGGGFAFDVSPDNTDRELLLLDDVFDFGTSFVGILGGGFRWFPGDRFLLRGDVALAMWQLESPIGYSDPARAFRGVDESEWASGPSFSLGLAYRF
jgi:hypothetical protein